MIEPTRVAQDFIRDGVEISWKKKNFIFLFNFLQYPTQYCEGDATFFLDFKPLYLTHAMVRPMSEPGPSK